MEIIKIANTSYNKGVLAKMSVEEFIKNFKHIKYDLEQVKPYLKQPQSKKTNDLKNEEKEAN